MAQNQIYSKSPRVILEFLLIISFVLISGCIQYKGAVFQPPEIKETNLVDQEEVAVASDLNLSVSHSPLFPQIGEEMTITATASGQKAVNEISIYVDSAKTPKSCTTSPCSYSSKYAAPGTHNYYVKAEDKAGNSAGIVRNKFVVAPSQSFTSYVVSKNANSVMLAWSKPNVSADGYYLWQRECGMGLGAWRKRAELASGSEAFSARKYTFTELLYEKCYDFKVVAQSGGRTETPSTYTSVAASTAVKQTIPEFVSAIPSLADKSALSVSISSDKKSYKNGETVTITAKAVGNVNLASIEIWTEDDLIKICQQTPCVHAATFASGYHYYYASITDKSGNTFISPAETFTVL